MILNNIVDAITHAFKGINIGQDDLKLLAAFAVALVAAYILNRILEKIVRFLVTFVARTTDRAASDQRFQRMRRVETLMSIGIAALKLIVVILALVIAWRAANPSSAPFALIGASTLFIVLAGATVAPLLRDITYGFVMTAERWYNVGDHIAVDPFLNLSGVVEQITLRSTKLRSLTGEVVWLHNQHIQAVRVTAKAVRTIAIDTFVNDPKSGEKIIATALKTLPTGATMVTKQVTITEIEQVGDGIWRISASGQTVLGREWLIENFAVAAIREQDALSTKPSIVHGPIVRYVDAAAEKRFRRSAHPKS